MHFAISVPQQLQFTARPALDWPVRRWARVAASGSAQASLRVILRVLLAASHRGSRMPAAHCAGLLQRDEIRKQYGKFDGKGGPEITGAGCGLGPDSVLSKLTRRTSFDPTVQAVLPRQNRRRDL